MVNSLKNSIIISEMLQDPRDSIKQYCINDHRRASNYHQIRIQTYKSNKSHKYHTRNVVKVKLQVIAWEDL